MGKFGFVPKVGESYQAFFMPKGIQYLQYAKLPEALDKGFTMNIIDGDTVFILNIRTNPETFADFSGKTMSFIFRQSEKPLFGHEITLNKRSELVLIPKSLLPAGITRITLYDEQGKPHCERLVYLENKEKVNVSITPTDDTTSIIKVTDNNGQPLKAYLSMSITNSIVPDEIFDIESYLWLESEIKGKIERSAAYFDTANHDRFKQIDLLLLTQGWRDFIWKHVEKNVPEFPKYEMEKGLKITGHVEKLLGKRPYPNANISLYIPDFGTDISSYFSNLVQRKGTRFSRTDSLGNYDFGYMNFFGNQLMFLRSRTDKGKDAGEIFINPTSMPAEEFPVKVWKQYQIDSLYALSVESYSQKNYRLTDTIVLDPVTISDRKDGHLISDREITPKDDARWMSLEFYLYGQAPGLMKTGRSGKTLNDLKITFYDSNGKKIRSKVPPPSKISMKEVDRVRIYKKETFVNASEAPSIDPKTGKKEHAINYTRSIHSVDVYSKQDSFTEQHYPLSTHKQKVVGSPNLSINSANGYYEEITNIIPDYTTNTYTTTIGDINYSLISPIVGGYYEERKFYTPAFYSVNEVKDYFGTYYWLADIRTGNNGETAINYNPQKQPSGKIRIEGITNAGIPFAVKLNN
jgi:hypothetical protein